MRILITGSEGSLMRATIPYLNRDNEVFGIDIRQVDMSPNYIFIKDDLKNSDAVEKHIAKIKPDHIIQAAAQIYGVGGFHAHGAEILTGDMLVHSNVLQSAVNNNVEKVTFISSSMVYESTETATTPFLEESIPDKVPPPKTYYGLSKYVNEKMSIAFEKSYGLPYTIWRPFNIITPYEIAGNEIGISHVFADFLHNIIDEKKNPLPIIGDGNQVRCFTWIDDVAQIIALLSNDNRNDKLTRNEIFNVGNTESITMRNLAQLIYKLAFPHKESSLTFETIKSYDDDVRVRIPDMSKFEASFGPYNFKNVHDSVQECVTHYYRNVKW